MPIGPYLFVKLFSATISRINDFWSAAIKELLKHNHGNSPALIEPPSYDEGRYGTVGDASSSTDILPLEDFELSEDEFENEGEDLQALNAYATEPFQDDYGDLLKKFGDFQFQAPTKSLYFQDDSSIFTPEVCIRFFSIIVGVCTLIVVILASAAYLLTGKSNIDSEEVKTQDLLVEIVGQDEVGADQTIDSYLEDENYIADENLVNYESLVDSNHSLSGILDAFESKEPTTPSSIDLSSPKRPDTHSVESSPLELSFLSEDLKTARNSDIENELNTFSLDTGQELEVVATDGKSGITLLFNKATFCSDNQQTSDQSRIDVKLLKRPLSKKLNYEVDPIKPMETDNIVFNETQPTINCTTECASDKLDLDIDNSMVTNKDTPYESSPKGTQSIDSSSCKYEPSKASLELPPSMPSSDVMELLIEIDREVPQEGKPENRKIDQTKVSSGEEHLSQANDIPNEPTTSSQGDSNSDQGSKSTEQDNHIAPDEDIPDTYIPRRSSILKVIYNGERQKVEQSLRSSKIPVISPTKGRLSRSNIKSPSSPSLPRPSHTINHDIIEHFFSNGEQTPDVELYLEKVFGKDPEIPIDEALVENLREEDIGDIVDVFSGKEDSTNWKTRFDHLDILICHLRLRLPEEHYETFQAKIHEHLGDILDMIGTPRSKLLPKVIIFIRDLVYYGNSLSNEDFIILIHLLLSLTRTRQPLRSTTDLALKSLCLMIISINISSFILNFDTLFSDILASTASTIGREKYASLLMIKLYLLNNIHKIEGSGLEDAIRKLIKFIPNLCLDKLRETRSEVIEIYLICHKVGVSTELLKSYHEGLTTYLQKQLPPPN